MTGTASEPEDQLWPIAAWYTRFDGGALRPTPTLCPTAALRWRWLLHRGRFIEVATALQTNKLLDATHTETLTMGKVETPNGGQYAYGFRMRY